MDRLSRKGDCELARRSVEAGDRVGGAAGSGDEDRPTIDGESLRKPEITDDRFGVEAGSQAPHSAATVMGQIEELTIDDFKVDDVFIDGRDGSSLWEIIETVREHYNRGNRALR